MSILSVEISDELMERLESLARKRKTSVEKLILVILTDLAKNKNKTTVDNLPESDEAE